MEKGMLFHEVSESEKEEIKKQAKKIMDDFARTLEKIDDSKLKEPLIERAEGERREKDLICLPFDRNLFLKNAPKSDGEFIIGERGGWSSAQRTPNGGIKEQ